MKRKSLIYHLSVCALMAAVLCVVGPLSLPIGPIPVSLANLVICLCACLLGWKWGTVSVLVYVLLGAFGMPVFSGYAGGLGKLVGPTGGYIIGYLFLALIGGAFVTRFHGRIGWTIAGLILGMAALYAFGTVWFVVLMQCTLWYALTVCVFPFLVLDLIKIVFAAAAGGLIRKALVREHLLEA